jgi:cell wall-associated NlpC family hydrolase
MPEALAVEVVFEPDPHKALAFYQDVRRGQRSNDRDRDTAEAAVAAVLAEVGKPYLWGATRPDSYECSGLTQSAYARAGVALPRTSRQQWTAAPHPAVRALARGDLVVYADDVTDPATIYHVALYLGDGTMVEAPRAGAFVSRAADPNARPDRRDTAEGNPEVVAPTPLMADAPPGFSHGAQAAVSTQCTTVLSSVAPAQTGWSRTTCTAADRFVVAVLL